MAHAHPLNILLIGLLLGFCTASASGQNYLVQPPPHTPLVVMNLAAHPDDEDGQTMAFYRWNRNAIVYSVIFSRGEGGQNEIGPELYEKLAAIRTEETERAARILGTQVYFLNFRDFGYSKFAWETFEKWGGRDTVIARLVYLIRKLKPDVLFTNHDTVTVGPRRQHGNHQAVGISAYAAFRLAADSTYHPEHFREPGVTPWQPARLFVRDFSCTESDVRVPVGQYDPDLGMSYADLAMEALRQHRSQGMQFFIDRFRAKQTCFTLYRSATDAPLETTDLAANLPPNTSASPDLTYWIDSGRLPSFEPGSLQIDDSVVVRGQGLTLRWDPATLPKGKRWRWRITGAQDTVFFPTFPEITLRIPTDAAYTYPKHIYQYTRFQNHPPLVYLVTEDGTGHVLAAGYLPVEIAPPLFLESPEPVTRIFPGQAKIPYTLFRFDPATREVHLVLTVHPPGEPRALFYGRYVLALDSTTTQLADTLTIPLPDTLQEGTYALSFTAWPVRTLGLSESARREQEARVFEVHLPRELRVGIIRSYDDTLPRALKAMGVPYVLLDSTALARSAFEGLHTIVVDIRAYLVRSDLRRYNDHLLAWVRSGGNLLVNYQKIFEWNPEFPDPFDPRRKNPGTFAPYPLILGRQRVTFEDAPVRVLFPGHPLFHFPERIRPSDWDGWVQERGLYFPESYAPPYLELVEMHDPGEPPLRSGILVASYGRGTYIYTPLVWYRQLRIYHPGAFRMYLNMLSLPLAERETNASSSRQNQQQQDHDLQQLMIKDRTERKVRRRTKKDEILALYRSGLTDIETLARRTETRPSYVGSVLKAAGVLDSYFDLYTSTAYPMNTYSRWFAGRMGYRDEETARRSVALIDERYREFEEIGDRTGQHHAMFMALTMYNRARWRGKTREAEPFRQWLLERLQEAAPETEG